MTREAMHDLTGAPSKYLFMDDPNLFQTILNGMKRNWAMTASSRDLNFDCLTKKGIIGLHSYSLLGAYEIN